MKIWMLLYDGFVGCDVLPALGVLQHKDVKFVALEDKPQQMMEGLRVLPDSALDKLDPDAVDLFLIPGGDSDHLQDNLQLISFIHALNAQGRYIAGICSGTALMAKYGLLDGKKCTGGGSVGSMNPDSRYFSLFQRAHLQVADVVRDGNIITATGQSFTELAMVLGKLAGVYSDQKSMEASYQWRKHTDGHLPESTKF